MAGYAIVRNCVLPRGLYYAVEENIWVRPEPDGKVTIGFTDVAQTTAGGLLHVTFRPTGKYYAKGKAVALMESGKWLGPLRTPVAGTLISVNEALLEDARLINRNPYGKGWLVRLEPEDLAGDLNQLLTGEAAIAAHERFMAQQNLDDCIHCDGFEIE